MSLISGRKTLDAEASLSGGRMRRIAVGTHDELGFFANVPRLLSRTVARAPFAVSRLPRRSSQVSTEIADGVAVNQVRP